MQRFTVSMADWPIVYLKWPAVLTPDLVEEYKQLVFPAYERGESSRFVTISDLRDTPLAQFTPSVRRIISDTSNDMLARFPKGKIGEAIVARDRLLQGIYLAIQWLRGDKNFVQRAFVTEAEARVWAKEILKSYDERASAKPSK